MDISKIEQHYKNDPEFKTTVEELLQHTKEFFSKEMENKKRNSLDIEKRIIQLAADWYNLTQEQGKTKEEALKEIAENKDRYDPIVVEGFMELYKKGLV